MTTQTPYEDLRPLLFSIAYRMLGSAGEAEDIVQEAFLRHHRAAEAGEEIAAPKAWLSQVTTRLAIDHLRSARVRRERYVGPWLPEPLLTDTAPDAARHAEIADSLSLAFLVVLERLSPVERAVFLLREVFDYPYDEIARIVERSEDNCRQIAVRARRHVEAGRPRFETSRREREEIARRFFAAWEEGDLAGLEALLAADAAVYGDGGGKAPAAARPVLGRGKVARFLLGLARQSRVAGLTVRPVEVNGQPGAIAEDAEGRVASVVALDIAGGRVLAVHSVVNPDKLDHLGEPADLPALFRRRPGRA